MGVSLSSLGRIETEYDWGEESCSRDAMLTYSPAHICDFNFSDTLEWRDNAGEEKEGGADASDATH